MSVGLYVFLAQPVQRRPTVASLGEKLGGA